MDKSKCREYTKDEIIDSMFTNIDNTLDVYAANGTQNDLNGRLDGKFVAVQVMKELDGIHMDYSYLELIAVDERADIHGELHSLFMDSNERLSALLGKGIITNMTAGFIRKVRGLVKDYDNNPDMKHQELVANIFDVVDHGIDGKEYRLDVCSSPEDKLDAIREGRNYYPVRALTLSGEMGEKYREKHLKREKVSPVKMLEEKLTSTIDPRKVVKNAAIGRKIPEKKVNALSAFWNKIIGKDGGTKDER